MKEFFKPKSLDEFIGQKIIKERLKVMIDSSKKRDQALDHILLTGAPGLGKTTLANVIANELGVKLHAVSAPMLTKPGDVAKILSFLEEKEILFIDEIHRLPRSCEELLYTAMEDFYVDIIVGEGVTAKTIRMQLPKFTLIGATTRAGYISNPFYSRFGIEMKFQFYEKEEIKKILLKVAEHLNIELQEEEAEFLADYCRMTPREAIRLLKRIYDYAVVSNVKKIHKDFLKKTLDQLGISLMGINEFDKKILNLIYTRYHGGPVGIRTLSSLLDEEEKTLLENYEPFLLKMGLIEKTSRGRIITPRGIEILKTEENYASK
ncbi:MAG: Holliday junction branch migration DNA helicase RuvB [Leptospiraceae bacterium]|nr:Holliday junction branch migration DNA helicase RuvB [Leptospiraceae bacterium]MDW7975781.1 Holliday junction branch migration DNA helicase RuvB [Leptospiraceae bacterium]